MTTTDLPDVLTAPTGRNAQAHTWTSPDGRHHTLVSRHDRSPQGHPNGGFTDGPGLSIQWQAGPVNEANPQNGAFVEEVIMAVIDRIKHYQDSAFASDYNQLALEALAKSLGSLYARIADRVTRGVQGSCQQ